MTLAMAALWTDDGVARLDLSRQRLTSVPGLERCQKLEHLYLADNRLEVLPAGLAALPALTILSAPANPLKAIDEAVAGGLRLREINFSQTLLTTLPAAASRWPLVSATLVGMPSEFAWNEVLELLDPTRLISLTVGGNPPLCRALASVGRFHELRLLHLNACGITELPASFAGLVRLETLSLLQNQLATVPGFVAKLPALRSLVVSKNPGTRRIKADLRKLGVSYTVT